MKKESRDSLKDAGFMHIDEYVKNSIHAGNNCYKQVSELKQYQLASDNFHKPGGDGFSCITSCLQKYLDYKFIQENNHFRFGESLFDEAVEICQSSKLDDKSQYEYIANRKRSYNKRPIIEGTQADLYFLLNLADQSNLAANRCIEYVTSNKLHLSAVLIQMIERIVEAMERDEIDRRHIYAEIIRKTYMDKNFAIREVAEVYSYLELTKRTYYRLRNEAISLISQTMFGVLAGEHGLADLYIRDREIILPELKRKKNGT